MSRKNGNGESPLSQPPSPPALQRRYNSGGRLRSRGDPFLVVCRCFSFFTAFTAILCIAVNVLSAVRSFRNGSDVFDGIFRCYAVVIGVFVVMAETDWSPIFKFWKVLEYWAGRGMLQIFVAVMTRAYPDYNGEREILGIMCIGVVKRARQRKENTRGQTINDLEELERKKAELEALLLKQID
ncbi:hypothetical protein V2J09_020650 [Rumex salicifolius]